MRAWAVAAGCVAAAAASLALPSEPTYDPWAWLVWGRELGRLALDTAAGPSWKPLPVIVTALLAPLAGIDDGLPPALWILLVRASGLLAIALAARVAADLVGGSTTTRATAGVLAAAALALSPDWVRYMAHGNEVPIALALMLGAVDRHRAGRPRTAFALGVLVVLLRPEAAPLVALYGLWCVRTDHGARTLVGAAAVAVPALWIVPEWLGSGDPLGALHQAASAPSWTIAAESDPLRAAVELAHELAGLPLELGALAALALWLRRRAHPAAVMALVALGALALVVLSTEAGFSGSERYFSLPLALMCVVAGAAGAELIRRAGPGAGSAVAAGVLAASLTPFAADRLGAAGHDWREAEQVSALHNQFERAARGLGDPQALDHPPPAANRGFHTHAAWTLHSTLADVERGGRADYVLAGHGELAGALGRRAFRNARRMGPVRREGNWVVLARPAENGRTSGAG